MKNQACLGLLINKQNRKEIYRQVQAVEVLENPINLSAEGVLPGFILDLS